MVQQCCIRLHSTSNNGAPAHAHQSVACMELWVFVSKGPLYSHLKTQPVVNCCERLHTSANIAQQETTLLAPTMFCVVESVCTGLNRAKTLDNHVIHILTKNNKILNYD